MKDMHVCRDFKGLVLLEIHGIIWSTFLLHSHNVSVWQLKQPWFNLTLLQAIADWLEVSSIWPCWTNQFTPKSDKIATSG